MKQALLALVFFAIPCSLQATEIAEQFRSCRCCCHDNDEAAEQICIYHDRGDSMAAMIRADEIWHKTHPEACAKCDGAAKLYRYCDDAPDHYSHDSDR